ncbi:SurA N-terminal domain-containing protein [Magnetococcus sp. PR-3]|uniref:SurA N-terminal domain-containing protein n=1 Tax=Magnetococcus sp. PR-3 TaxID=3120355 RepID=UPI002FCE4D42
MLNVMRKSANSWVIKTLLILIAVSFSVWGIEGLRNAGNDKPVITVEDWSASRSYVQQSFDTFIREQKQQLGNLPLDNPLIRQQLRREFLQRMVNDRLLLHSAMNMGMTLSPKGLQENIANDPMFQRDGQFNDSLYRNILRQNRLDPKSYEADTVVRHARAHLAQGLTNVATAPTLLLESMLKQESEKRQVELMVLDQSTLAEVEDPGDEALRAYQEQNRQAYTVEKRAKVRYLLLDAESIRGELNIDDAKIAAHYEESKHLYQSAESRQIRHILAKFKAGDEAAKTAAQKKIDDAKARLANGEAFADVAKALSEDITANMGGSLGKFQKGSGLVPSFEKVAFELEAGTVSDVVETPFGYHLIVVDGIEGEGTKPLSAVKAEIEALLFQDGAGEAVYNKSIALEDMLASGDSLASIGKDLNLHYKETDWIEYSKLDGTVSIEKEAKFHEVTFSTLNGERSTLVELSDNRYFVVEVIERQEPTLKPLKSVRTELLTAYRTEKAQTQGKDVMDAALKALKEGQSWQEAAKKHAQIQTLSPDAFTAGDKESKVPATVRQAAFRTALEKPLYQTVISDGNRRYVLKLTGVTPGQVDAEMLKNPQLAQGFSGMLGNEMQEAFMMWRRKHAEITMDPKVFDNL